MFVNKDIKGTNRIFPEQGRNEYYRYDMNENPEGLPEDFVKEVLKELTPSFLSVYPETSGFIEKYSRVINAKPENVLPTNGSDMAIRYILETFGEKGKDVITVHPTFGMYAVNCNILGLRNKVVSYNKDLSFDTNDILNAIDADTRIVVLLNPNSPIGNVFEEEEIEAIIEKAKSCYSLVLIDEAYFDFYGKTNLTAHFLGDKAYV